jgi:Uma2 family endonuclease
VPSPAPRHNPVLTEVAVTLHRLSEDRRLGVALIKTDIALDANTRLRPDVSYFSVETWRTVDTNRAPVIQKPLLVADIISPEETFANVESKLTAYFEMGHSGSSPPRGFFTNTREPGHRGYPKARS